MNKQGDFRLRPGVGGRGTSRSWPCLRNLEFTERPQQSAVAAGPTWSQATRRVQAESLERLPGREGGRARGGGGEGGHAEKTLTLAGSSPTSILPHVVAPAVCLVVNSPGFRTCPRISSSTPWGGFWNLPPGLSSDRCKSLSLTQRSFHQSLSSSSN